MIACAYVSHRAPTEFDFPATELMKKHFYRIESDAPSGINERYVCVCKLDDIWQLHRKAYESRANAQIHPYLLDLVQGRMSNNLRNGRCFVLLDLSGEGHPLVNEAFDDLHGWCTSVGLARENVGLVSQNRAIELNYCKRYEGERKIVFFSYDWIVHALARKLSLDDQAFISQFGFAKTASLTSSAAAKEHPFLCFNATPRPLRVATLAALKQGGVLPRVIWSLLIKSSGKGQFNEKQIVSFLKSIDREGDLRTIALELLSGTDKRLEECSIANSNQLVWSINYDAYHSTLVSIVTETDFSSGDILRVTEKTIKALAMAHPCIVFGNPGSLDLACKFGFQSFAPLIDEGYDKITMVAARFQFLCDEIKRLNTALLDDFESVKGAFLESARFNAEHARSGNFLSTYVAVVERPFISELRRALSSSAESHSTRA